MIFTAFAFASLLQNGIKLVKDPLQEELRNTLRRRKPVAIVEPPKYDYPQLDDPKTGSNADESAKSVNLSKTLAVVSAIKLPESVIMTATLPGKGPTDAETSDKQKITHAKPNFTLPKRKPIAANSIDTPIKTVTHRPLEKKSTVGTNKNSNGINANTSATGELIAKQQQPQQTKVTATTTTMPALTKVEVSSIGSAGPSLSNGNHSSQSTKINIKIDNIPTVSHALRVDVAQSKPSYIENNKQNHVTESVVANKKAIFEKKSIEPVSNGAPKFPKSMNTKSPYIEKTMSRLRNGSVSDMATETNGHHGQPSSSFNSMRNKFCRDERAAKQSTNAIATGWHKNGAIQMTNQKLSNCNNNDVNMNASKFGQKTFVSFSKDLQDAPNRYPEKVHVTKTITTTERYVQQTQTVFQNVRFSIDDQAHVVPKLK